MIRLIALHGKLSGSVVLKSAGGRTEFMLKTRQDVQSIAENPSAFLIAPTANGGFRMVKADIVNGSGSAEIDCVRGIVVTCGNAIISEGSSGMSNTAFERAKVQLRLKFQPSGGAAEPPKNMRSNDFDAAQDKFKTAKEEPPDSSDALKQLETDCTDSVCEPCNEKSLERTENSIKGKIDQKCKKCEKKGSENDSAVKKAKLQQSSENSQISENAGTPSLGSSPVTRRILSQAKTLFTSGDSASADDAFSLIDALDSNAKPPPVSDFRVQSAACMNYPPQTTTPFSPDNEAVKNPFPARFPNSTWRKKAGDNILFGKVKSHGILYSVTAIPMEGRYPPTKLCGNIRRARAENGKPYWLGIKRI